ncbi:MAG: hypothetical protein M3P18_07780 [Actinomycetota bacterium]|nr:hypothetical protein [Actinomycetota bacterium]
MHRSSVGSPQARVHLAVGGVAIAAMLLQPLVAGAATPRAASLSPVLLRTSKNFRFSDPWRASCEIDFCQIPSIVRFAFDTPSTETKVDVDVALSLNFKVSSGDKILVDAGYSRDGGPGEPFHPGTYPLTSPNPNFRTSTTVTWSAKGLDALGSRYVIEIAINPRHGVGGFNVHASGTKAALTVTEETSTS